MASELETTLKNVAMKVAKYVEDAATLTVETRFVEVGAGGAADFIQAKPIAQTIIKLDGDCSTILPLRKNEAGVLEVDAVLFEQHQQNVQTAIDYRTSMLDALLNSLVQVLK